MRPVAIALGSSLGNREQQIREAARLLATHLADFRLSSLIETPAEGEGTAADPPFLNAAGVGRSDATTADLVRLLMDIEQRLGRTRSRPNAPRTLDLDLILAGDDVADEPGVQVPHPRFRERRFVLAPLAEVAPDLRDPVSGLTMRELLDRLEK